MREMIPWRINVTHQRESPSTTAGERAAEHTMAEVVVESQHGDPRYLDASRKTPRRLLFVSLNHLAHQ